MDFRHKILNYCNISDEDYADFVKQPLISDLPDYKKIKGLDKIKDRIFKAIENNQKIIVYGDYDCDGVCATSIMVKAFEMLGYNISYYIPTRYHDGYGLSVVNVEKIHKAGFNLIITVDNGICQNEAIDKANELGMDVIVVDHHEAPEIQVNAFGILHPIISDISDIYGCGGFMALILSAALLDRYDSYLIALAGLSTISDMMELKSYNRVVVKLALKSLEDNKYPSLISLCDSPIITEKTFGLEIAPKINAIGRLVDDKNINLLVKFLVSENADEIFKISSWIKNTNELRKTLTKEAVEKLPLDNLNEDGIVLNLDIKEGLIGLIANRLLNEYQVPSIVFTKDSMDENFLKGSIRSKEGFNVQKAFESLNKYLVAGGGHALAGGLTIRKADFDNFKKDFLSLCKEHKFVKEELPSIEIEVPEITFENYKILRLFAPFGIGFPEPLFSIKEIPTKYLQFISGGKHLSTPVSINTKLLGFNMNEEEIKSHQSISLFGNLLESVFRDKKSLEFRISDFITKD